MKTYIKLTLLLISATLFSACAKLTDLESPKNELTTDKVFADTASAKAAIFNCYVQLERGQYPLFNKYLATYADEIVSNNLQDWNQSRLPATETFNQNNWSELYSVIFQCNMALQQLGLSAKIPAALKTQLASEAKFLRAYSYLILVNMYNRVPLISSTVVDETRIALQSDSASVYNFILNDLNEASAGISTAYPGTGKIRANKAAVTALLARLHLFLRNWALAESLATQLISSGIYTPLEPLAGIFKAGSKESILQLSSQTGFVQEASGVVPGSATAVPSFYFSTAFYNSFEAADLRKTAWIGSNTVTASGNITIYRYPAKYKNRVANTTGPENLTILRISEQYLIRAEARAQQGKLSGVGSALEDLNIIRTRAGLSPVSATSLPDVLTAICNERRHELFFENGDRFFTLKRRGTIQTVMSAAKSTWLTTAKRLPIPQNEITYNKNLTQNEGY